MEKKLIFKAFKVIKSEGNKIIFESTGEYESTVEEIRQNMIESIKHRFSELEMLIQDKEIKEGVVIMPFIEFSI